MRWGRSAPSAHRQAGCSSPHGRHADGYTERNRLLLDGRPTRQADQAMLNSAGASPGSTGAPSCAQRRHRPAPCDGVCGRHSSEYSACKFSLQCPRNAGPASRVPARTPPSWHREKRKSARTPDPRPRPNGRWSHRQNSEYGSRPTLPAHGAGMIVSHFLQVRNSSDSKKLA